jgi:hypothetical protein
VFLFLGLFSWIALAALMPAGAGMIAVGVRQLQLLQRDNQLGRNSRGAEGHPLEMEKRVDHDVGDSQFRAHDLHDFTK